MPCKDVRHLREIFLPYCHGEYEVHALQRFGIEGCEALLPGLRALVRKCAHSGVQHIEVFC